MRGMFKLTGSTTRLNYSISKLKMRDMLMCKKMWLPVQFGKSKLEKFDASTWEVMHLKVAAYIRRYIDMSLYNNFNEETNVEVRWKKVGFMFENTNAMHRVSVFKNIIRLRY